MKFSLLLHLLTWATLLLGANAQKRIFDGTEVTPHAFPSMISLRLNFLNIIKRDCGGVLISDIFLLTAASCFHNVNLFSQYFIIKAGAHDIAQGHETTEQSRSISHLILHPDYNGTDFRNDLALVHVFPPFNLSTTNVAIMAISNRPSVEKMDLVTIGWGVWNQSIIPTTLQQAVVQEDEQCLQQQPFDRTKQLCATGTCVGDTGSPLMFYSNDNNRYELIGVTGFRTACTTQGLFTRIAPFIAWITGTLENPPPTPPAILTPPSLAPTIPTTTTPEILGPPIPFVCNTSYSCGCSSVPVVFHDRPAGFSGRIVGGEIAQAHSWPWVVSLRFAFFGHTCGGSLISSEWVLTAAHCVSSLPTIVHIGVHDETQTSPQVRNVVEVIAHPDYVPPPKFINDIALMRVSPPIDLGSSSSVVGLACRPPQSASDDYPAVGTSLAVIGWGRLSSGGSRPTALRQVRVKTLANDDWRCANASFDKDRQFCAMVDGGGKDSCQGDSGGPIHQWLNDHWEQVGIVSYGTGCALASYPGVYTRLSFYDDWIQSKINNNNETTTITPAPSTTVIPDPSTTVISASSTTVAVDPSTTVSGSNTATVSAHWPFFSLILCLASYAVLEN